MSNQSVRRAGVVAQFRRGRQVRLLNFLTREPNEKESYADNAANASFAIGRWLWLQHASVKATKCQSQVVEHRKPAAKTGRSAQQLDRDGQACGCSGTGSLWHNCQGSIATFECNQPAASSCKRR